MKPLCIDLYAGLGGWTEGFIAEGYRVIGFDIERRSYPGELVIQDVLTLHGSQFRDATAIVASPPCQRYSYMAMPWKRGKRLARIYELCPLWREDLNRLFNACFRIQQEAIEAADRYIPLVVENVCGAQRWVGPAKWRYGSFYLWGDVPALMPYRLTDGVKVGGLDWSKYGDLDYKGHAFNTTPLKRERERRLEGEQAGVMVRDESRRSARRENGTKSPDPQRGTRGWFGREGGTGVTVMEGTKDAGAGAAWFDSNWCVYSSRSDARKAASAQIAKIPFTLARHIARSLKNSS